MVGITAAYACILAGAIWSETGKERDYWEHRCVIVARVSRCTPDSSGGLFTADLQPIATLAGRLDPSLRATLSAKLSIGRLVSAIPSTPSSSHVIAVISGVGSDEATLAISPAMLTFMPAGLRRGLIEITGLDDPAVTRVLAAVRELRAHEAEYPVAAPRLKK